MNHNKDCELKNEYRSKSVVGKCRPFTIRVFLSNQNFSRPCFASAFKFHMAFSLKIFDGIKFELINSAVRLAQLILEVIVPRGCVGLVLIFNSLIRQHFGNFFRMNLYISTQGEGKFNNFIVGLFYPFSPEAYFLGDRITLQI